MRERTRNMLPPVLVLSCLLLLAIPLAGSAQSGDQATLRVRTGAGDDGAGVEVIGLGFPGDTTVVLELATPSGTYPLATVATNGDGSFRDVLAPPARVFDTALRLDARSASGTSASHDLLAADALVVEGGDSAPVATSVAASGRAGAGSVLASDDVALVLIAVVLGALATAFMFAYRAVHGDPRRPGMGAGDDLIWGGTEEGATPEPTATDEPFWKRLGPEAGEGPSEAATRKAPTSA